MDATQTELGGAVVQPRGTTVQIVTSDVEPGWEGDFNRWYDEEHIPAVLRVPGCLGARRYVAVDGEPKYMALYELASIDAFRSPEHAAAVDTPWTARILQPRTAQMAFYRQIVPADGEIPGAAWDGGAATEGGLIVVRLDVDPAHDEEFNRWYAEEHLPAICAVPGTIAVRRFRAIEGGPAYLFLTRLTEPDVQRSEAWRTAADTPWTARLRPTFRNFWRVVYRPLGPALTGTAAMEVPVVR